MFWFFLSSRHTAEGTEFSERQKDPQNVDSYFFKKTAIVQKYFLSGIYASREPEISKPIAGKVGTGKSRMSLS